MSTISQQQQQRNGSRRAFGKVINNNITPKKKAAKGGASIADEVHSAKKDNVLFSSMVTRSSKKRAASLREADDMDVAAATESMGLATKVLKTSAVEPAAAAAAVLPKTAANTPLKGGEESAAPQEVFRSRPEEEDMDSAFWNEMEDLLEIKLANPIRSCSEDEFDLKSDEQDIHQTKEAASGDV